MLPSFQGREVTIKDYVIVLKRRVWIILVCLVTITLWVSFRAFKKIPLYRASAKILIERQAPEFVPQRNYDATSFADKEYIQSQINVINSRRLAKKVVESLIAAGDTTFVNQPDPEERFLDGVVVSLSLGTQIVNIQYISPDPLKAAKYANALTNAYIQNDIERRSMATRNASGFLEGQLSEAQKKLQDSEAVLVDYLQKNQMVSVPEIDVKAQSVLDNLRTEKLRIESELAELSRRYKSKHPKIISVKTKLESVNKAMEEETKKMLELNAKLVQYNLLKRDLESSKRIFEELLINTKVASVAKEFSTTNIRIVDWADVPKSPFSPNRKREINSGIMLGLLVGIGLAFFLEYIDSTIKTAGDVEAYVRLPFLGYIPCAKQEANTPKDIDVISSKLPHSRIAEAYRSVRTSIIFSAPEDRPLKTILVTSAAPQEGKSTVLINLGIVFANSNEKTILVEADMRRPRIASSLGFSNKEGLSSFLAGTASLESVIQPTFIPNLFCIPSGPHPPNPAELLVSTKTRQLLEELKMKYDRIIIDSPPIASVTDTAILANIVDGVIDVIKANFLNIDIILRGRQRLYEAKARIVGVILNNVNVKKEDSYYYYHYYYAEEKDKKT